MYLGNEMGSLDQELWDITVQHEKSLCIWCDFDFINVILKLSAMFSVHGLSYAKGSLKALHMITYLGKGY